MQERYRVRVIGKKISHSVAKPSNDQLRTHHIGQLPGRECARWDVRPPVLGQTLKGVESENLLVPPRFGDHFQRAALVDAELKCHPTGRSKRQCMLQCCDRVVECACSGHHLTHKPFARHGGLTFAGHDFPPNDPSRRIPNRAVSHGSATPATARTPGRTFF